MTGGGRMTSNSLLRVLMFMLIGLAACSVPAARSDTRLESVTPLSLPTASASAGDTVEPGSTGDAAELEAEVHRRIDSQPGECFGSAILSWPPDAQKLAQAVEIGRGWLAEPITYVGTAEQMMEAVADRLRKIPDLRETTFELVGVVEFDVGPSAATDAVAWYTMSDASGIVLQAHKIERVATDPEVWWRSYAIERKERC